MESPKDKINATKSGILKKKLQRRHFEKEVGVVENRIKCDDCGIETKNIENMQIHIGNLHDKEVRHSCGECDFKTFHKSLLKKHQNKLQHNTRFEKGKLNVTKKSCKFCKVSSLSSREIVIHMKIEHPKERLFDCKKCGFKSNWKNYITLQAREIHDKEVRYACGKCDFNTFGKSLLIKHQYKGHNTLLEGGKKIGFTKSANLQSCKFCKVSSLPTIELGIHTKIMHPKERLFECDECEYRSNWKQNITMHKNGKHRSKKLFCSNCTFESFWRTEFSNHKRTVHGILKNVFKSKATEKPSSSRLCDICGFQAKNYGAMFQHKINKKCKTLKIGRLPTHIDDVRTEIFSLKKNPCQERSDKQKIRLHRLQEKLCRLKYKLRPTCFQKSERRGRKKAIISVNLVGMKNTEDSDAIKVLREMDRYQTYMSWKDMVHKSVKNECDTIFEISSEVKTHDINNLARESLNKAIYDKKSLISKQAVKEKTLNSLESENLSTMTQTFDEAISIIPTASLNHLTEETNPTGGKTKLCNTGYETEQLNDTVELENYNFFKTLLGIF